MTDLRKLLWLYLWLLIFEGALRKWIVPALDTPLLIIRDPLVIWIYFQAVRQRLSFNNAFFVLNLVLAGVTALLSTVFGLGNPFLTIYGLRTDFLQIPLIFLIPQILNRDDVIAMGKFLCYVVIPFTVLVMVQFRSPPDSLVNKGTMGTHYGTVRPSGTFSFGAGLADFFALISAFVLYGCIQARTYKIWLMALATFAILIASACSGSRACLASVGLVAVAATMCVVMQGKGGMGMIVAMVLIGLSLAVLSTTPIGQEGAAQLQQRMKDTAAQGEDTEGFVFRFISSMLGPLFKAQDAPIFGYGLGLGTSAAAAMDLNSLYWPEEEWDRLIFECGPLFGILLCIFRTALTIVIGRRAWMALRSGNALPMLIFASCALLILNGQWGVGPTTLGFAIFGGGLTLAACVVPHEWEEEDHEHEHDDAHSEDESDHSPATDRVG